MKALILLVTVGVACATPALAATDATAAEEEITSTPPALTFKGVTAAVESVSTPNVVVVAGLGECALIGVHTILPDDLYYDKAKKFVKERVDGETVRVEVCPNEPLNERGQKRALIYYRANGKWLNLSIELINAGLGLVADVPACHVPTKGWLQYEKQARAARRGMWADAKDPAPMASTDPDESDFK